MACEIMSVRDEESGRSRPVPPVAMDQIRTFGSTGHLDRPRGVNGTLIYNPRERTGAAGRSRLLWQ
jgi:hypothetical protein